MVLKIRVFILTGNHWISLGVIRSRHERKLSWTKGDPLGQSRNWSPVFPLLIGLTWQDLIS